MREYQFQKAVPIWAAGREKEKNCELAFRVDMTNVPHAAVTLSLAASTIYQVWVNGRFVAAGPARAAHGFYRVDEVNLTEYLTIKENIIVIRVVGYNVNSYDTLDQLSFLTAEILQNGVPVAYTGDEKFQIYDLHERVQRVQRYSFQRAFAECYSLVSEKRKFYTELKTNWEGMDIHKQKLQVQEEKNYIYREFGTPLFENLSVQSLVEVGKADFEYQCPEVLRDRSYLNISDKLKGFKPEELEEHLSDEGQNIDWIPEKNLQTNSGESCLPLELKDGYAIYSFPLDATGFLNLQVKCDKSAVVYILFDEILREGKLDFYRSRTCNCFKYKLNDGIHEIVTMAPYTMKYVKVAVKGKCVVHNLQMVEYKHPPVPYKVLLPEDVLLQSIYEAALETYLANASDVFMDCPSRERAGWLCDSFFTARVEHVLTGEFKMERAFLENFLVAEGFPDLPEGMLPMCYPADHNDGNFIPNWAMWYVLQLEEFFERSGDQFLIEQAKERIYGLVKYFERFENEFGLLERLEKWVFVEWSRANAPDVVQDVNFPTNMLYAKMLSVIATLYGDMKLQEKAARIKSVIRERALQGIFYTDNERRTSDGLMNPGNTTEVCQYYAFFTGVASKETDKELWDVLIRDFGPKRKDTRLYPDVDFANAFIGNYLRMELIYLDKQYDKLLEDIKGFFREMPARTGTLWEHDRDRASCNHGFASCVIYWLDGIYGKKRIDDSFQTTH